MTQPELTTAHLVLRPFSLADAPDVQRLAGDREIASTTLVIPHPYEDGMAEAWIGNHPESFTSGVAVNFAMTCKPDGALVGAIGLSINQAHERAELGYWVGKPYWGKGYCSEAAKCMLGYGFEVLSLNRIVARHLTRNPASGRVMQKVGMTREGRQRQGVKKWGVFEDLDVYSILRSEWPMGIQGGSSEQV